MFSYSRKAVAALSFFLASGAAIAQSQPAPQAAFHEIGGFRSAHFGMDEAAVRAAVAQDFKDNAGYLQAADNPAAGVRLLVLPLPALEPGPGPAGITYIFGAHSHRLIQVNVLWSTGASPTEAERNRLGVAGVQLSDYFRALKWRPNASTMGVPLGANGVVLFSGIDPHDAMVEVSLTGIPVQGKDGMSAAQAGPARLRVAYLATSGKADVAPAPQR